MRRVLLTVVILFISVSICFGQGEVSEDETIFNGGVGMLVFTKPHKGGDTEIYPLPMVFFRKGRLVISGTNINYYFIHRDGWAVSALGKGRFEGYDDDEGLFLNGMHDREWTYELSVAVSKEFGWGKLTGSFSSDVLGEHKGHEIQFKYSKLFKNIFGVESLSTVPMIGMNWRSKQLNDYYYGVEGTEVSAIRAMYEAGSSVGVLAGLRVDYSLSEKWNVFGAFNYEWLGGEITDSPIVGEDHRSSLLVGAMYKF